MSQIFEVWQLSEDEYIEIETLFEKKLALENLFKIIDASNQPLYDKLLKDYGGTIREFNAWWENMSQKYDWKGTQWFLDFETRKIMGRFEEEF